MRRVKHNHRKGFIRIWHIGKIAQHVRFDFKMSPIA